jgi:nucleotide-binding universal stress UspA family protein
MVIMGYYDLRRDATYPLVLTAFIYCEIFYKRPSRESETGEIVDRYAPQYMKLLIPHDGSESSDRVLAHAIYLSKISNAEIVILNVVEDIHEIAPTTIAASKESVIKNNMDDVGTFESELDTFGSAEKASGTKVSIQDQNIGITIEGKLEEMMKERINICKDAGVKSKVSYLIQTGKASERIVSIADERDIDLIIMASGSLGSTIKGIMSNTRKVIDSTKVPVLIINE